jgi:uncharacterized delta-60 repeat protein
MEPDGKIMVGSCFSSLNGIGAGRIARLNADGDLDFSFQADVAHDAYPASGLVQAIAVQADDKVVIGGTFTTVNGASRTNIARLNDDGSLDFSFDTGSNTFGAPIALQTDAKVLVGGDGITRLNVDGTRNDIFNPTVLDEEWLGNIYSITVQPDTKIIIAGTFTTLNGLRRANVARLNPDGSLDLSFNALNVDGSVETMAFQADGKLLIGGPFASVDGFARNYVARLLGDSPILKFQKLNNQLVLSWTNAGASLQSAPAITGTFTYIPAATSPYTNSMTGARQYFRLSQ